MTCKYPNACKKLPDKRYDLCRSCALSAYANRPDAKAKFNERMAEANEKRWAWCPPGMRDEYNNLKAKKFSAAEAKAMIFELLRKAA